MLDDPFAVFSAGWLVERMGCEAIILVRDPVSFVGSWRALGWAVHFHELLEQPLLVRDHLDPYVDRMRQLVGSPDWLARTCLLWEATYDVVDRAFRQLPGVHLLSYEGLVEAPLDGFADMYARVGLTWSPEAARAGARGDHRPPLGHRLDPGAPLVAAGRHLPDGVPAHEPGDGAQRPPGAADPGRDRPRP